MSAAPILFVLPDLGGGGAQKVMLSIAGGLHRATFAPRILVAGGSQAFASYVPADIPIENGGARRLRDALPWLIGRIRADEPAVCVSVMGYLNLLLLGSRRLLPSATRLVIREANTVASTADALPRWMPGLTLYRALYPRADAVVSPTTVIAEEIARLAPRCAPRIRVIANPVDVEELRARATPPMREPGAGLRLVSAGRLTPQKGYDRLIDLIPLLPRDARLRVFGEGEERGSLEARSRAHGVADRVSFPGFSLDVPAWIAGADAFVLPSRWEGLPNVVLESLALGTPAIVSDEAAVGDLSDLASPGAVVIRAVDATFAAAVQARRPAVAEFSEPRPSLLPRTYEKCATVAAWESLLEGLMKSPRGVR